MTLRSLKVNDGAVRSALRSSRTLEQHLQPLASKATNHAKDVAAERTERHTGRYMDGFKSRIERSGSTGKVVARVVTENKVPYAAFIESGTRPHLIRVRRAKVLYSHETDTFFGKQVNHPGTTGQHVIEVAIKRLAGRL